MSFLSDIFGFKEWKGGRVEGFEKLDWKYKKKKLFSINL